MKLIKILITLLCIIANLALICTEQRISFATFVFVLLFFSFASAIHLLLHECGHLVGGLLSGYQLVYFQAGPINLVTNRAKKLSLSMSATHGGQCIMVPSQHPPLRYRAYNLGGVISNSAVCIIGTLLLLPGSFLATLFFVELLFSGLLKIVSNCFPCLNNSIPNDGYIVKLLDRNQEVQKDYTVYLTLYAALFWKENILKSDYSYQRFAAVNEDELLYYNGMQELLDTVEEKDNSPEANKN